MKEGQNALRQLPLEYWLRVFGDFLTGFGRSMLIPFMLVYLKQESGFPIWVVTLMTSVPQFFQLFSTSWGGVLADFHGRKPIMFVSLAGSGLVLTLMYSSSYLIVYAGYVTFLVVSNFYRPAAFAMVTDVVPQALHRDAFAVLRTSANLGFALGPLVGSLLFFTHRSLAITGTSLAYVITAFTVFWMRETAGPVKVEGNAPGLPNPLGSFVLLKRDVLLLWAVLTGIFFLMVQLQLFSSFTIVVNDEFQDNGRTLALLLLVNTVGVVLGQYFVTSYTRNISFYALMVFAIIFAALGWSFMLLPLGTIRFYLIMVFVTFAEMFMSAGYNPYIASLAHEGEAARYMSFTQTSNILGQMIGPTLGALGYGFGGQRGYVFALWVLLLITYGSLYNLRRKVQTLAV